jgi:hypothetical protein
MQIFDEIAEVQDEERPGASRVANSDSPEKADAINGYRCDRCKKSIFVEHVHAGVTPMFMVCKVSEDCGGLIVSLMYPTTPLPDELRSKIQWEWYRPTQAEFEKLDLEMKHHVALGGLVLRRKAANGVDGD